MKILFDNIIYSLQKAGGISTYWSELSKRFLKSSNTIFFIENSNDNLSREELEVPESLIIRNKKIPMLLLRFLNLKFGAIPFNTPYIFHSSYNRINSSSLALNVVTIHDFVHEKYYHGIRRYLHSYQKLKAIRNASAIITVSENTKNDLIEFLPEIDTSRIHVIYNGVSDSFFKLNNSHVVQRRYFLYVGSREKYKNFEFAAASLAKLPDFDLIIVGKMLEKKEVEFLNNTLKDRWQLKQNISNAHLNELYNTAFALLYPSSYEGFGIPLLEAMRSGCPFIAYKCSSIPEVAGSAGVLLDRLDMESFELAVNRILLNRDDIISKGFEQCKKFSWDKCFNETLVVYQNLLNK